MKRASEKEIESCRAVSTDHSGSHSKIRPYIPKRLKIKPSVGQQISPNGQEADHTSLAKETLPILPTTYPQTGITPKVTSPTKIISSSRPHNKTISCLRENKHFPNVCCTASLDKTIAVVDLQSNIVAMYIRSHTEGVKDVRWSNDSYRVLSGGFSALAFIHDVNSGKELFKLDLKDYITSVLYHPQNEHLFIAGTFKSGIVAIDSRSAQVVRRYKTYTGQVHDLLFLPDQTTFLSAAEVQKRQCIDKAIISLDFESGAVLSNQIYQDPFPCTTLRLHPNEFDFLAQSGTGYIAIFSVNRPYKLNKYKRFEGHQTAGYRIGFSVSCDGNLLASGDNTGKVFVYDYYSTKLLRCLELTEKSVVTDVTFRATSEGSLLAATWDGSLIVWD